MTYEIYAAFVVAASILLVIPGPTIMLVIARGLSAGRRDLVPTVAGVALGDAAALTLSLLGVGTLLAASAFLFTLLKWGGAAYLVFLGIKLWRSRPVTVDRPMAPGPGGRREGDFADAFTVTALNPKSIVFFVAFMPQFILPTAPILPQAVLLGVTFVLLAALNAAAYGLLASSLRARIGSPSLLRLANRLGGVILIGAGALLVTRRLG